MIILYLTLFFWAAHILHRILFYLYFCQLKEYRRNRLFEEIKRNKNIVFPKIFYIALFLFLASFYSPLTCGSIWEDFIFILYLFFGAYALYLLVKQKWQAPKFTKKMIVLAIFILFSAGILSCIFLDNFLFFILIFEIFLPLFIFLCAELVQIPTFFARQLILKKAKQKRQSFKNLTVIGITGSYGKTSTKEFLATILSQKYNVLKTQANINVDIGIAQTILQKLNKDHEFFICEMGAYTKREIKSICDMVQPKIGILTGINEQHLALFGSQENIIHAKFELIESLPQNGMAVLNWDNQKVKSQKSKVKNTIKKLKVIKCSAGEQIQDLEVRKESLSFKIEGVEFNLNLVGKQNVENLLMAICCAKELGMDLEEISNACEKIKPLEKTMRLETGIKGITIVDDSYSANPKGVFAALDYLKLYSGQKIIIMPCLIELGKEGKRVHEEIGQKIGQVCDLAIITTRDYFKEIKQGAISVGMDKENILFLENPKEIFEKIKPFLRPGNIILLESRVPSRLIKELTI